MPNFILPDVGVAKTADPLAWTEAHLRNLYAGIDELHKRLNELPTVPVKQLTPPPPPTVPEGTVNAIVTGGQTAE